MYHNDYVNTVKQYLIRYREFSTYISNIYADIEDYEAKLTLDATPKVPVLSSTPGGSDDSDSQQERIYFEKESIPDKIAQLRDELQQIEPMMNRLNRSLEALVDNDRAIVVRRLADNDSWLLIASDLHTSESYCRRRMGKVLEILAGMMFGPGAIPVQTQFVFYEKGRVNDGTSET